MIVVLCFCILLIGFICGMIFDDVMFAEQSMTKIVLAEFKEKMEGMNDQA